MKLKHAGLVIGFAAGLLIAQDFVSAAFLALVSGLLFDSDRRQADTPGTDGIAPFEEQHDSPTYLQSIVALCIGLLRLKGNILFTELNVMKSFMADNFGIDDDGIMEIGNIAESLIRSKTKINPNEEAAAINRFYGYDQKLNIIHLLFVVAASDARITPDELDFITRMSQSLMIQSSHFTELKNVYVTEEIDIYKTLAISTEASVAEIKRAYRKLARQYHPDALRGSPDAREKSKKFQDITAAYKKALAEANRG